MDTNACRTFRLLGRAGDGQGDRRQHEDARRGEVARANYLHWAWQIKFEAAKNVANVVDKMLHACGGSGYKRDMELERYLRDGKAGWVMGPTNEVLRQFVGKAVLLGFEALDYWNQSYNRRAVENEIKKLDADGKRELAEKLMAQAAEEEAKAPASAKVSAISGHVLLVAGSCPRTRSSRRTSSGPAGRPCSHSCPTSASRSSTATAARWPSSRSSRRDGRDDATALGATADAPATVVRDASRQRTAACSGASSPRGGSTRPRRERYVSSANRRRPARRRRSVRIAPLPSSSLRRRAASSTARLLLPSSSSRFGAQPRTYDQLELPPPLAEPRLDFRVDAATALAYEVRAGEFIQVIDVEGKQCSDFLAFHRRKLESGLERGLDATTTRSLMGQAYPQPGLQGKFYDTDQDPLVEVVRDTVGRHDTFGLACTAQVLRGHGLLPATSTARTTSTAR